jgi:arginase
VSQPRVAVIGAASSAGARQIGQEQTPAHFRRADLLPRLRDAGFAVDDLGDIAAVSFRPDRANRKSQNLALVVGAARQVADRVAAAARARALPLVIGGDCTVTLGVLAGLAAVYEDDIGLLYFDADVDLNTPETTTSGIFDGMGIAHILGGGDAELAQFGPRQPLVPADRVVLFAFQPSAVDADEKAALDAAHEIVQFPLGEVAASPAGAAERALAEVEARSDRYVLHFDVDSVDYVDFPVAEVPHFGALPYVAARQCLEVFLRGDRLAAVVITEFNALRDPEATYCRAFLDDFVPLVAQTMRAVRARRPSPHA